MRKVFLLFFLIIYSSLASAVNYYISNSTGNDGLDGKSVSNAWKTISKINGHAFSPGDSILFKKGDSWRETLTLPSSGLANNYIVFSAYGTGENPRILGSTQAITWTEFSTNIWKSSTTFSSNPYVAYSCEIFFENMDGTKSWGTYKAGTANLAAEYNWAWVSSNIYIYSTSDPTTRYTSVEVPQRESAVNMNKKNYIHFDGIDMFYTYWSGYGYDYTHYDMYEQFGLIIENSDIGYIGAWDASIEQGYGIEVVYTDMIVRNNLLHDCGRRSFAMDIYGSGYTARNIVVEDNEFYNGFHTTGLDIDVGAGYTGSIDGVIVRRNKFYETSPTRPSDYSNLIFIQNNNPGSCSINNVYIYSNIFKWPNGYGILMESAQSIFIYNNVFCDKNIDAGWAPFIAVQGSSQATVENNIFYRSSSGSSSEVEKNGTTTSNYNLYYNCTVSGSEANGIFSKNPLFVDPGNNNFHLQAGSPAIGAGIAISEVTSDFEKNAYTSPPNVGCYGTPIPTTNPVFIDATIENATPSLLEIRFNKALANIVPVTSAFTVRVNSVSRIVNSVAILGAKVQLTLSSAVAYGDVVTIAYTKPLLNPVQSSMGVSSDSFTAQSVINNVSSNIPVYVSSVIDNATPTLLGITYNLTLANVIPATTAFTVMVNSISRTVNTVTISGTIVRLTLASAVVYGDIITVAYTMPVLNPLQTSSGGKAATFTAKTVTNNVNTAIPVYASSVIENATPTLLSMTYSSTLANITPAPTAFSVLVNSAPRSVNSVVITGSKVQLTLASAVIFGDIVTVAYSKPVTNPIQTSSGGQAVTISAKTVTNNVSPASPIYVNSVIQNATSTLLEMTYQLTLANITPAVTAFSVTVNSSTRSVNSVSINGTKVQLTLSVAVIYGDIVTVAYSKPVVNPLQTPSGASAATLSPVPVTNNVGPANPLYISSLIEDATPALMVISFNQTLANIIPAVSAFTVKVNSTIRTVNSVAVSGTEVMLNLESPVLNGDVVTIEYTNLGTNPLQNSSGVQVMSFTAKTVSNNVGIANSPPVIILEYADKFTSGFVGEIDASGSTDINNDILSFSWTVPDGIDISSATSSKIQFLAPVVSISETFNFTLNISDGKASQTEDILINVEPFKPQLSQSMITNITSSSYAGTDFPANINDGSIDTYWSADGDNQWLTCRLRDPFRIDHLKLSFPKEGIGGSFFDILASRDSLEWDPLLTNATSCGFSGNLQVFTSQASNLNAYQFIKLVGHGNSLNTLNKISELKVFGGAVYNGSDFIEIGMIVYPNPAKESINIFFQKALQEQQIIRIASISGVIVYFSSFETGLTYLQIPVTFPPGFYIIQLISNGKIRDATKLLIH